VIVLDWSGEHSSKLPLPVYTSLPWNKIREAFPTLINLTIEESAGAAASYIARRVIEDDPPTIDDAMKNAIAYSNLDKLGSQAVIRRLELLRDFVTNDSLTLLKSFTIDLSVLTQDVRKLTMSTTIALLYYMMEQGEIRNTVICVEEAWYTEFQKAIVSLLGGCRKYNNKVFLIYQTELPSELIQCNLVVFDLGPDAVRYLLRHTWPLEMARVKSPPYCYVYFVEEKKWCKIKVPRPPFKLRPKIRVSTPRPEVRGESRTKVANTQRAEERRDVKEVKKVVEDKGERVNKTKIPVQIAPKVDHDKLLTILETMSKKFDERLRALETDISNVKRELKSVRGLDVSGELAKRVEELTEKVVRIELAIEKVNELSRTVNKLVDVVKAITLRLEEMEGE